MVFYKRTVFDFLLHSTRQLSVSELVFYKRTESVSELLHSTRWQIQSLETHILKDIRVGLWTPTFYKTSLWMPTFYKTAESVSGCIHSTKHQSQYLNSFNETTVSLWTPTFYKTSVSLWTPTFYKTTASLWIPTFYKTSLWKPTFYKTAESVSGQVHSTRHRSPESVFDLLCSTRQLSQSLNSYILQNNSQSLNSYIQQDSRVSL